MVLHDGAAAAVAALALRLGDRLGRDVQIVRLREAERSPVLMADVLAEGRVLVDSDRAWPALVASRRRWERRAAVAQAPLAESMPDLELA